MSAIYHTPLGIAAGLSSLALNTIFGSLDQAIVDMDTRVDTLENVRIGADGVTLLNLDDGSTKTLASNAITRSASYHRIDTEGAAASDFLDTINGGNAGDVLVLELANAARTVTLRHGQDNVVTAQGTNYTLQANRPIIGFCNGTFWKFITEAAGGVAVLEQQEASGVNGGSATTGSWETRNINTKANDVFHIAAILKLPFTSGGTYEVVVGNTLTGLTSGKTAIVFDVELTSGSWAGGNAAGNFWVHTQSGAFTPGETCNVGAELNVATLTTDTATGAIRLKAGTYRASGWGASYLTNAHQMRLQDTTNTVTLILGGNADADSANLVQTTALIAGRFTLAAAATLELQHRVATTRATSGYGQATSWGTEVYASLTIEQEI